MAATLVGGAFLSVTIQILVEKLASTELRDFIRSRKLNESLLAEMETTLLALQVVLDDAEQKQILNPEVKDWLDRLKDAIFDAEDLLNEISYDSLRCKMENKQAENTASQVSNFISSPFKNPYGEIISHMEMMCQKLQLFAQQRDILGLQTVSGRFSRRAPTSSIVDHSIVVGRNDDKKRLVNMLLSESGTNSNNIGVVAIWGMGGVGKTTLAQLLYNDKEVQEHFDMKAWACVSEDFDILRVTKTLLETVTSSAWESNDLDFLRVELKQNLRDKRFLFVLDDLWNDNYNDWCELVTPFIDGKSGCRVIITTRQQRIAEVTHTFPIHNLEPLSHEDGWFLLSKHAFGSEDFRGNPDLTKIGRKIASKCGGLPIATKTLGGLLRSKVDANEWNAILNSNIWNLPNDNIVPALFLSYQYLPSHLKRCFSYCSIFPKDYPIDRKQLVLLWMAEGFLEHSQGEKALEEVGEDYFFELLSRSLIQQSNDDSRGEKFVMHDLVHDLAVVVSGRSCNRLECSDISEYVRHLSYNQEEYDIFKRFEIFKKFVCLRSFLPIAIGPSWQRHCYLSRNVVDDLLPTLKRLRVLSLSYYRNITMLPDSVGSLVQMRYLDVSHTGIKSLPDTICNLYNLQTLNLSKCEGLTELPVHIEKLIDLRHLDISGTNIKEMPMQIVRLKNLQTLTVFVVGKQKVGLSVSELQEFPNLRGKLCIKNLHNVVEAVEAYDANLKSKEHIQELELYWGEQTNDSRTDKTVLNALQPSTTLKKLSIDLYGGTCFSSWLGDSSFSNLVHLCIRNCEYCVTLPPLGQLPSLKDLVIDGMKMLETIGPEFYGMEGGGSNSPFQPFSYLEKLQFANMPSWTKWIPFEGSKSPFPHLKTLRLRKCPELRGHLPGHISSMEQIEIRGCGRLLETPPTLHWLSSIKHLDIEGDLDSQGSTERRQWLLLGSDSPCLLQVVWMRSCDMLLSLPKMIISSTCLRDLYLSKIQSLTAFPADGLPTSLQSLHIYECENLAFLPPETWSNYTSLVALRLWNSCDALTSFPLDGFPALRSLSIYRCRRLKSISISKICSHRPSTLQSLEVYSCKALRSLPERMDTLTALEQLYLSKLPKLELSFCEGAWLPPKLRSIRIESMRIATPVCGWGLQRLTALSSLHIGGGCDDDIVSTLLKEPLLPISLVSLTISDLYEMKSLPVNGLRHLTSLETLYLVFSPGLESLPEDTLPSSLKSLVFHNCPRLESLPKDKLPSSLETLKFWDCPRLESFPEHWFPSSLKQLSITKCPLLEARYESARGEHWPHIAHIPVIKINDQLMII